MAHDSLREQETAAWLQKALDDLRSARLGLDAEPPLTGDSLFHCQQAVEKAEKALLLWHDKPFRKIHDLAELGAMCAAVEPGLETLFRGAEELTVFATAFRYPSDSEYPSADDAERYLELSRKVCEAIKSRLPQASRLLKQ